MRFNTLPRTLEWRALAPQLLFAFACLLAAVALVLWRQAVLSDTEKQLQHVRQERIAAEQRLSQSSSEGIEIRQHAALFNRLVEHGMLGPEQRLEWTELLRTAELRLKLPKLDYEFQHSTVLDNAGSVSKGYRFYNSRMRLQAQLVEEEDLLRLLTLLQREATALIRIQGCKITRLPATISNADSLAQLTADCQLDWITAQLPGAD
jgi:hypothetical protein